MFIPLLIIFAVLWSLRSYPKSPSINEILFLDGELVEDLIERKGKEKHNKQHTPFLEQAYEANPEHPKWVVRVWQEQGKLDNSGNYKG